MSEKEKEFIKAIKNHNNSLLEQLIDDIYVNHESYDDDYKSLLEIAVENDNDKAVELLIDEGAKLIHPKIFNYKNKPYHKNKKRLLQDDQKFCRW